jgi:hypothetical protein
VRIASRASACRYAAAPNQIVVLAPSVLVAGIVFETHDITITARLDAQAQTLQSAADHVVSPYEHGSRKAFVDNDLRRAQNPIVLALGEGDPLRAIFAAANTGSACWRRIDT